MRVFFFVRLSVRLSVCLYVTLDRDRYLRLTAAGLLLSVLPLSAITPSSNRGFGLRVKPEIDSGSTALLLSSGFFLCGILLREEPESGFSGARAKPESLREGVARAHSLSTRGVARAPSREGVAV